MKKRIFSLLGAVAVIGFCMAALPLYQNIAINTATKQCAQYVDFVGDFFIGGVRSQAFTSANNSTLGSAVPNSRTVAGYALSSNVSASNIKTALVSGGLYSSDVTASGDFQYLSVLEKTIATQNATALRAGYLSYTDWETFNNKVSTSRTIGGNALSADITNSQLKTSVLAAILYSNEVTPAGDAQYLSAAQKAVVVGNSGTIKGGLYEVIADDDTANTKTITTGLSTITSATIQVLRANVALYGETITFSAGNITVADGSPYVLTTGDVIRWIAIGSL